MKILYIEAKSKTKPEEYFIDPTFLKNLPKKVFLCYTIQNKGQAETMKKALEHYNIAVTGFQQVLGCSKLKVPEGIAIILIGQGRFHALNLALQNKRPIIQYGNGSSIVIGQKEIEQNNERKKNSINLFLHAQDIGIIVSTKPGQEYFDRSRKLKQIIEQKYSEKNVILFVSNNINTNEFENFDIDFWINSACPGLINDSPKLINIDDIFEFSAVENIYSQKQKGL